MGAQLSDVALTYTEGSFKGLPPVLEKYKPFDVAYDTDTGKVWQCAGLFWVPPYWAYEATIQLAYGATVQERIENPETIYHAPVDLFNGEDVRVPPELYYSRKDLVINHKFGAATIQLAINYIDPETGNIVPAVLNNAADVQTTSDGMWTCIKNLNCLVGLGNAVITVYGIGTSTGSGTELSIAASKVTTYLQGNSVTQEEFNQYVIDNIGGTGGVTQEYVDAKIADVTYMLQEVASTVPRWRALRPRRF